MHVTAAIYVYVVSDSGAVFGGVVVTEDGQELPLAHGNLGDVRHEIIGRPVRILA